MTNDDRRQRAEKIKSHIMAGDKQEDIAAIYGVSRSLVSDIACGRVFRDVPWPCSNEELVADNTRLAAKAQKAQDTNRIERRSFRDNVRLLNALTEYNEQLIETLNKHKLPKAGGGAKGQRGKGAKAKGETKGVLHFTDAHFNELVEIEGNRYDFSVAAARMRKLVQKAKVYFNAHGVREVLVACTGDLMNSDRRLDELLNMATNRSHATFLAVELIEQMLLDLAVDYHVGYATVSGNESRAKQEHSYSQILATDNYDFTIHNILEKVFQDDRRVTFYRGDPTQFVVRFGDRNLLLVHGESLRGATDAAIDKIRNLHASKGVIIDLVLCGHLHYPVISDVICRAGSLVGSNAYAEKALYVSSRASQNAHLIHVGDCIDSIKIDVQNVDGITGYPIDRELEAYNAKSAAKVHDKVKIVEVSGALGA
jgi:predicted phosphodiesterase/transcriptional regulator with XRE-family HTH domain